DRLIQEIESTRGGYRVGRAAGAVARYFGSERRHAALIRPYLAGLSALVVSGGGQVDGLWGGPWGHPYALWKWSRVAARRQIPFFVLSVGAGVAGGALSRWFLGRALRQARYRSYRDSHSREIAASLGLGLDPGPVVPDLAFGYEMPVRPPSETGSRTVRIGISPIAFRDPRVWPVPDAARYERYLSVLAGFIQDVAARGHEVVLFTTDGADTRVVADLCERVRSPAVVTAATPTLAALAGVLAGVDVVVASRLHGVLLAHVAGRPVLALSYDWKVDRHMEDLGQGAYRASIDLADPAPWILALEQLIRERARMAAAVESAVERARTRVLAQYAAVFP
ncbi:MAG TPA: polysaccharide pyruvyl transferase family protein, partial [Gemmatimonadales bacterium]|nr:polysaccharide pyruvyl transferase family protein [Gemmatimonadales bacterium]